MPSSMTISHQPSAMPYSRIPGSAPMQPSALRALEFDRIVEAVTSFALTPMGAERLARLAPSLDPHKVAQLLAATSETTRFIAAHGLFPLKASSDLPQIFSAL